MTARLEHPALRGRPIYLDYNATTPIDPVVVEAMTPYLIEEFGNPSSSHAYGAAAQIGLSGARHQVAELIGAPDDTMVFTGSGSEADALAIRGAVLGATLGPGGTSSPRSPNTPRSSPRAASWRNCTTSPSPTFPSTGTAASRRHR